jgi:hypothetical protein
LNGSESEQDNDDPNFIVVESEQVEADRERIFLQLNAYNPAYAMLWLEALNREISELSEFPGPRANAVDEVASSIFKCEVRSLLFQGPSRRRSRMGHHIVYTILPAHEESVQIIRILRILYAARGTMEEAAVDDTAS